MHIESCSWTIDMHLQVEDIQRIRKFLDAVISLPEKLFYGTGIIATSQQRENVDTFKEEEEIDLMAVRKEREELKQQLEERMEGYLGELGYDVKGFTNAAGAGRAGAADAGENK